MNSATASDIFRYHEPGFSPDSREHRMALTTTPNGSGAIIVSDDTKRACYGLWIPEEIQNGNELPALKQLLDQLDKDQLLFIPSTALLTNSNSVLVPGSGFSEEDIHRFHSMAFSPAQQLQILSQEIPWLEATAVFSEHTETLSAIRGHIPGIAFRHIVSELLPKHRTTGKDPNSTACTLFLTGNSMFVGVLRNSELIFYNSFNYKTTEEMAYYLAAIARNLELEPASLSVSITGVANDLHYYCQLLTQFFPETRVIEPHPALKLFSEENSYRFHLLATHLL